MGRYVFGVFAHGLSGLDELEVRERLSVRMPDAFGQAYGRLAARWNCERVPPAWSTSASEDEGIRADAGLVNVRITRRLALVRPGPRWLGFARLGELRELSRALVWAVGTALGRSSAVVFGPDQELDDLVELASFDEAVAMAERRAGGAARPLAAFDWLRRFGRPCGEWALDTLDDIPVATPLARCAAVLEAFHASGGIQLSSQLMLSETEWLSCEDVAQRAAEARGIAVRATAPGAEREARWSGELIARVGTVELGAFRDLYEPFAPPLLHGVSPAAELEADARVIATAIELACATRGSHLELSLRAHDVVCAGLALSVDQMRALAAAGASLDLTVVIEGSS
jgi:hypothetical protein